MSKKIYVRNLNWDTNELSLGDICKQYGQVLDTRIIKDRETGRSRGFGFVTFNNEISADDAIRELDGATLDGRTISVEVAIDKRNNSTHQINS